jgi:glutamate-5-semialdehyde dehydrogenase
MTALEKHGAAAKAAAMKLMTAGTNAKNEALEAIARALADRKQDILDANAVDMANARANDMRPALMDRLLLDEKARRRHRRERPGSRLPSRSHRGIRQDEHAPERACHRPQKVPLGVIAIIYESRPNVTVDAAVLCLKAGNAVILRGGKEAFHSNNALTEIMRDAIKSSGLPEDAVALVQVHERGERHGASAADRLCGPRDPQGRRGLIQHVVQKRQGARCRDGRRQLPRLRRVHGRPQYGRGDIFNAKTSRPSVCNAAETLLVDRRIAKEFLPMAKALLDRKNTQLRGCPETVAILGGGVAPAADEDYWTEYGDYILAVKVVAGLDEAIAHVNKYGTKHSEAIVTSDYTASQRFLDEVDAAAVYVNASTRFTDGGEFGLGAEIGISTQKMHARGPMGLEQLTSMKYVIYGSGQTR